MQTLDIIRNLLSEESPEAHCFSELTALPPGAEYLKKANIASDLVPRAQNNFLDRPTMDVIGNDSPNLSAPRYPWPNDLKRWLSEKKCSIRYLLLNPSAESLRSLADIKKQVGGERLSVFILKKNPKLEGEWLDIIKQWETFHFALFDNPRQMWVETEHKPGVTDASGCYFLSPELASESGVYEVLKGRFEYAVNHYADQI